MFENLFKRFNRFYEKIYLNYSSFLSKYYLYIICLSFIFNLLISFGIFNIKFITDQDTLFNLVNSKTKVNELYLKELYSYNERFKQNDRFYVHQLLDLGLYAEINFHVALNESENIIKNKYIDDIISINKLIRENITIIENEKTYKYTDLCAKQGSICSIEGETLLFDKDFLKCKPISEFNDESEDDVALHLDPVNFKLTSLKYNLGSNFKYIYVNNTKCIHSDLLKLRYALNQYKSKTSSNEDDVDFESLSKKWEIKFIDFMNSLKLKGDYSVSFTYSVSQSIEIELKNTILSDIYLIAITITAMFMAGLLTLVFSSSVISVSNVILPIFGMLCGVGGLTSAIGFLSLIDYPACELIFLAAFILIGKCIIDTFAIKSSIERLLGSNLSMVDIMARVFKKCDLGLGLNSLTIGFAFLFGFLTSFKALQIFAVYTAVANLFCYFYQITFLLGWVVVYLNRMSKNPIKRPIVKEYEESSLSDESLNQVSLLKVETLTGEKKKQADESNVKVVEERKSKVKNLYHKMKRLPEKISKFFITKTIGKIIIAILFSGYLAFSIYNIIHIDESLQIGESVSDKSYFKGYVKDFLANELSPPIMIVFPEPLEYQNKTVVDKIKHFIDELQSLEGIKDTFRIMSPLILDAIGSNNFSNATIQSYKQNIVPFLNDLVFAYNQTTGTYYVQAVRFYVQFENLYFNLRDTRVMRNLNKFCDNFEYRVFAYSPVFKNIELFDQLAIDLMQIFVITIEIAFLLSFLFIFNLKSAFCISLSIGSIFIGFCGFMSAWNVSLNMITIVDFIVGLAISSTSMAYVTHLFLIELNGESKSHRAYKVIKKYGISIAKAHAIMATTGSILAFSQSFSFFTLFKTILIANLINIFHVLLFVPVLLSVVGPHWKIHQKRNYENIQV